MVLAANHMGNTAAREKSLAMAREELDGEEYEKLMQVLGLQKE